MAIGWLTVLKLVPWGDVIENAPKVAQGAKKLWNSVGKKPLAAAASAPFAVDTGVLGEQSLSPAALQEHILALQVQVAELQGAATELHQQMLESSALIKSLAEQNSELIVRMDINRKRLLWLAAVVLGLAITLVVKLF